jgi:Tol biopolymer transport system component
VWGAVIVVGVVSLTIMGLVSTRMLRSRRGIEAPQVRSLTAYQGFETAPSFSPDGTRLAFVWNGEQQNNFDIYVRMVDESATLRLTTSAATDYNPIWSPDGRFIAFLRSQDGSKADILLIPSIGGSERKIAEVFYYAKSNGPTSLWRVSAEGGGEQLVLPSLHRWSHFAVFEDGIYFMSSIKPPTPSPVQFYDFATRTTNTVATIEAHTSPGFAVSPDRRWMLYVVHERTASDLMLLEHFR